MTTMFYTRNREEPIGQIAATRPEATFTWCMYPLDFARLYYSMMQDATAYIEDEYGRTYSIADFAEVCKRGIENFDERIE